MKDLSMHILDITENSVKAGASEIKIELQYKADEIRLTICDNGCGMDEETVKRVTDPYTTSRTTRKVGLGLPFLKMNAEMTGGGIIVESEPGKGTRIKALFKTAHIDCIPDGDLPGTFALLMTGHPDINFKIEVMRGEDSFLITSNEIKEALEGISISHPKVHIFIRNMLKEAL